jgi:hypothetical protein
MGRKDHAIRFKAGGVLTIDRDNSVVGKGRLQSKEEFNADVPSGQSESDMQASGHRVGDNAIGNFGLARATDHLVFDLCPVIVADVELFYTNKPKKAVWRFLGRPVVGYVEPKSK